jgi:hypothetical protein
MTSVKERVNIYDEHLLLPSEYIKIIYDHALLISALNISSISSCREAHLN